MSDKILSRRELFSHYWKESKSVAYKVVDAGIKYKFRRKFVRPPGAIAEEQFLLTCTRCDDCVSACPYNAIHLVEDSLAGVYLKTPFIDPFHEPCRFCEDMPCITSCKSDALLLSDPVPPIGKAVFNIEHCLVEQGQYCDYCYNSCPNGLKAITKDAKGMPVIADNCTGCGKCVYICVSQSGPALSIDPA